MRSILFTTFFAALLLPVCAAARSPSGSARSAGRRHVVPGAGQPAHRMGGEEPLPPVPQRGRFPRHVAAERGDGMLGAEQRLARASRRPRLGARHGRAISASTSRADAGNLPARRRARNLSGAGATTAIGVVLVGARAARRDLRLDLRRRRRPAAAGQRALRRGGAHAGAPTASRPSPPSTSRCRTAPRSASSPRSQVRDLLIAGMGDSIAAGEGNPGPADRARRRGLLLPPFSRPARSEYFRPGRAGFSGNKACDDRSAGIGTLRQRMGAARARAG